MAQAPFKTILITFLKNNILNLFIKAYIDNILVFSKTLQEYKKYVKTVLASLQAGGLQLNIKKYRFEVHEA